jgi:hypothetical protein
VLDRLLAAVVGAQIRRKPRAKLLIERDHRASISPAAAGAGSVCTTPARSAAG